MGETKSQDSDVHKPQGREGRAEAESSLPALRPTGAKNNPVIYSSADSTQYRAQNCVKVEVAVLASPSLISLMVSVNVNKQSIIAMSSKCGYARAWT